MRRQQTGLGSKRNLLLDGTFRMWPLLLSRPDAKTLGVDTDLLLLLPTVLCSEVQHGQLPPPLFFLAECLYCRPQSDQTSWPPKSRKFIINIKVSVRKSLKMHLPITAPSRVLLAVLQAAFSQTRCNGFISAWWLWEYLQKKTSASCCRSESKRETLFFFKYFLFRFHWKWNALHYYKVHFLL